MRALIALGLILVFASSEADAATTIFIWRSPAGKSFTCQQFKAKRGTTLICAPPDKQRTMT